MINDSEPNEKEQDEFKNSFKYYKAKQPKPSFKEVLSYEHLDIWNKVTSTNETEEIKEDTRVKELGLINLREWKQYTFHHHPGLLLIRNPFTSYGQRYWIRKCLEEYPKKPNKLNIDIEVQVDDWWKECFVNGTCNHQLQNKLRWTTLGYHHNWDTKVYTEDIKTTFPEELAELSNVVAKYLGYKHFKAEAAIINYYHMDSTLSAHTDHSEVDLEAPLLSFSFGQSAIFLIGGRDKSVKPTPILLRSGDIIVMSKESRLCYHAVPRILLATSRPWEQKDNQDWTHFKNYIENSRINMNVRQVLRENQTKLEV